MHLFSFSPHHSISSFFLIVHWVTVRLSTFLALFAELFPANYLLQRPIPFLVLLPFAVFVLSVLLFAKSKIKKLNLSNHIVYRIIKFHPQILINFNCALKNKILFRCKQISNFFDWSFSNFFKWDHSTNYMQKILFL